MGCMLGVKSITALYYLQAPTSFQKKFSGETQLAGPPDFPLVLEKIFGFHVPDTYSIVSKH